MSPSQIFSILSHFSHQILILTKHTILLPSTILTYLTLVLTHLKCAFEVLLYNQYSFTAQPGSEELVQITRFEHIKEDNSAENVCAVCLGEVKEGEEIGELRCSHVFHHPCLQRWVRLRHTTCPLCRGSLAPPPLISTAAEADFGVEVLFFKFCSFRSNDDVRDSWWLR